jgi:hypothetical protein
VIRTRIVVVWAVLAVFAATATAALASCPDEHTSHCAAFSYLAHRRTYHLHGITFALDGRPKCAKANGLIKTWLRHGGKRIDDPADGEEWFLITRDPFQFTAGLCGSLIFRI